MLDEGHPSISRLTGCLTSEEILNICDVKDDDDFQAYRLNNDKAVAWLKAKVLECLTLSEQIEPLLVASFTRASGLQKSHGVFSYLRIRDQFYGCNLKLLEMFYMYLFY